MSAEVVIDGRFNGPANSANGGYACGTLAHFIEEPAEVTLRLPPPLDTPLEVVAGDGEARMLFEDNLVAEARTVGPLDVQPPVRPALFDAEAARARHPGRGIRHPLSDCFVCGPERADGLHVSIGPLPSAPEIGATPFSPDESLCDDGVVRSEFIWSALDCSSYTPRMWQRDQMSLLGRLAAERLREVRAGEQLVAIGWDLASEGRKHTTASALLTEEGELVARAKATWIQLRPQAA